MKRTYKVVAVCSLTSAVALVAIAAANFPQPREATAQVSKAQLASLTRDAKKDGIPATAILHPRQPSGHFSYPDNMLPHTEQEKGFPATQAIVPPFQYTKGGFYNPPPTWPIPEPPYSSSQHPLSGLPEHQAVQDALSNVGASSNPMAGTFEIYQGWQVNQTTQVWIGDWSGLGIAGAITISSSGAAYAQLPVAGSSVTGCKTGSLCSNGMEIVGIKGDEVLILNATQGYIVFNWQSGISYISNQNGSQE